MPLHLFRQRSPIHLLSFGTQCGAAIGRCFRDRAVNRRGRLVVHDAGKTLFDAPEGEAFCFFLDDPLKRFERQMGRWADRAGNSPGQSAPWNVLGLDATDWLEALGAASMDRQTTLLAPLDSNPSTARYRHWYGDIATFSARLRGTWFAGFESTFEDDIRRFEVFSGWRPSDDWVAETIAGLENCPQSLPESVVNVLNDWYADDLEFIDYTRRRLSAARAA